MSVTIIILGILSGILSNFITAWIVSYRSKYIESSILKKKKESVIDQFQIERMVKSDIELSEHSNEIILLNIKALIVVTMGASFLTMAFFFGVGADNSNSSENRIMLIIGFVMAFFSLGCFLTALQFLRISRKERSLSLKAKNLRFLEYKAKVEASQKTV